MKLDFLEIFLVCSFEKVSVEFRYESSLKMDIGVREGVGSKGRDLNWDVILLLGRGSWEKEGRMVNIGMVF